MDRKPTKLLLIILSLCWDLSCSKATNAKVEFDDPTGDRWGNVAAENFDPAFDVTKLTIERLAPDEIRFTFTMAAAMPAQLPDDAIAFQLFLDLDRDVKTGLDFSMLGKNIGADLQVDLMWSHQKWIIYPEDVATHAVHEIKGNTVSITVADPRFFSIEYFKMFAWVNGPKGNMDVCPNDGVYGVSMPIHSVTSTDEAQKSSSVDQVNYSDALRQLRDAYAKSKADPGDLKAQYQFIGRLAVMPGDMQVPLAVDFCLVQKDLTLETSGASTLVTALSQGMVIQASRRGQAAIELKKDLGELTSNDRRMFEFAVQAANALLLLGDDTGLDILLTDKQTARNYCVLDEWDTDSDPSIFQQLATKYHRLARTSDKKHCQFAAVKAALYNLCRARRLAGQEIVPLHPLVNLQELLPK